MSIIKTMAGVGWVPSRFLISSRLDYSDGANIFNVSFKDIIANP